MAGINFLRRLLMKQAMQKSKDASGIMSLNKNLVKDVDDTVKKWVESAKKQGQDIDKMGEQEIRYIVELNKPKVQVRTLADMIEKLGLNDPKKNKFLRKKGEVVDLTGKTIHPGEKIMGGEGITGDIEGIKNKMSGIQKLSDELGKMSKGYDSYYGLKKSQDVVTDTVTKITTMEPVAAMKEANLVISRKGKYKNLTKEQSQKILKDTDDWIFQRDPDDLYDYNKKRPFRDDPDVDPEDFAQGGRTGYFTGALADTEEGKSMSPGTRHDYSPGQGHREPADARDLAEINKFHNMKFESMELPQKPKRSIKEKIGGGINKVFNNPLFRSFAALGTTGLSEKARTALLAKQLYDNRHFLVDDAIDEEIYNIPTTGGITPAYAQGGRTGLNYLLGEDDQNSRVPFKKGHSAGRRKFLKGIAALATVPIIGKYFKWAKPLAKSTEVLTSVPIKTGVDGMPVWFKPLVNKVIKEGEDMSGVMSAADREIVHGATLPGSKTKVFVTQDLTSGDVVVDIGMGKHGFADGLHGQPVRLNYKASEVIEPSTTGGGYITKGGENVYPGLSKKPLTMKFEKTGKGQKTKEEFWVEEAEFTGGHPENIKFEESTIERFGNHGSNFDEVERLLQEQ